MTKHSGRFMIVEVPRFKFFCLYVPILILIATCGHAGAQSNLPVGINQGDWFANVSTDRALYNPLSMVQFGVAFKQAVAGKILRIVYDHLDSVMGEDTISLAGTDSISWSWQAPDVNHFGVLVELFLESSDTVLDHTTIGVDVSSSWNKFPRYGFLSAYPYMGQSKIDSTISVLNRYHINGLQFYDWQYKHNEPLAGTVQNPDSTWKDIGNRTTYLSTVEGYIRAAHEHGMKAMNYNLLYGAYADAYQDGVDITWSLYSDPNHQSREYFPLPPPEWASNLYIMDPGNSDWQNYICAQERKVFLAIPFDGWHVDQLGYLGSVWNYDGQSVNLTNSFSSFLSNAKTQLSVDLVMNAVGQYGQQQIAQSPVDFLYTEVWPPDTTYFDLVNIINQNTSYSDGSLATVLAAYMDDISNGTGYFNTPGVLLTDAVIFAAGGDHLELGEHMLYNSYFPAAGLQMTDTLQRDLVRDYDFMVAYENLLRDGEVHSILNMTAQSGSLSIPVSSSPQVGGIWSMVSATDHKQIVNLINFDGVKSLEWRDTGGRQTAPDTLESLALSLNTSSTVVAVWCASPDFYDGAPVSLPFTQNGGNVSVTLPGLVYWDMVVVQYDSTFTSVLQEDKQPASFRLYQNYPNPFNPTTVIGFDVPSSGFVSLKIYDVLGREVRTLVDKVEEPGSYSVSFDASSLPSGVYFYRLVAGNQTKVRKMLLVK